MAGQNSHQGKVPQYKPDSTHALTEEKNDAVKDPFKSNLDYLYDKCPVHDIKIIFGDFNAKARRYLWSYCRTVQSSFDNFAQQRETW